MYHKSKQHRQYTLVLPVAPIVKEAIWERVENPTLNKRGGLRFQLSHAWNIAIKKIPCRLSPGHPSGRRQVDMHACQQ